MSIAAAAAVSFVLWASSASAGPGVIVAPRVEAFDEPSDSAKVISELERGAAVLVLDEESHADVVHRRPGWLAIRLPGSSGVGYVHIEAVDLATASSSVPKTLATAPATPPLTPEPSTTHAIEPAGPLRPQIDDEEPSMPRKPSPRAPLVAGGFLPLQLARFMLGFGSGAAWLREQSAAQNHIGSSGATFNTTLGLIIYDIFTVSTSGAFIFTSDKASFSQEVMPEFGGDPSTADSNLEVGRYSLAVGLRTPFWALVPTEKSWLAGALFADYGWAGIHGNRSISDCIDCRSQDLELPGGTFWRIGLDLAVPSVVHEFTYGFTAAYQRYRADAALAQELQLSMSMWWH